MNLVSINIKGIETNNLKNIDVVIKKNTINLIIGPSGSGKSSLAYDTISQIGLYEFNSMYADMVFEPYFRVKSYSNMIVTVPIKQINTNNNIRSTIGTYFNINHHIALIFSTLLKLPYDLFILNREENACPKCHGIGYEKKLDVFKLIDNNVIIKDIPVRCWNRYKDFYAQILKEYCLDNGIDYQKKFFQLTKDEQKKLLYGESNKKYTIRFKKTNSFSSRTTRYFGVMTERPMFPTFSISQNYYSEVSCSECNGLKYAHKYQDLKIQGMSIGELMCTPFSDIIVWLETLAAQSKNLGIDFSFQRLIDFSKAAISLNLGYLFFNRIIPSLSGGEFQRIKLVQVFNTQLMDLLIVLDEPLSGLSSIEKEIMYKKIISLSENNTVVLIDHHDIFYNPKYNIIALGNAGGKYGGEIIDSKKYILSQSIDYELIPPQKIITTRIKLNFEIYTYCGVDIQLADKNLNLITGFSGVGKSTLLREYLPYSFENYTYINQKPLVGNSNSNVATALGIAKNIFHIFATEFKKDNKFFSNHTGDEGVCTNCQGSGYISYGNDFQFISKIVCKECRGTGFNKRLLKYKIKGNSIFDIWNMTLDEAISFFDFNNKMNVILQDAKNILLGHLILGQPVNTLSGGENVRIKILKALKSKTMVYGIDEPFRGLNNSEIHSLAMFFYHLVKLGKMVIIADHEDASFKYFQYHIELNNIQGRLVGQQIS
ncbi:ATP-binding cassette domain-containing protein [Proteus mirabilis]|uniref:ATP-binding cassette domain-containing protein n=1 Tax=Proteus mirabilis TaxID=584 RepID=UPI0021BF4862|nr:ATP-binding cassette domain-containing protein [Proteus mirabilis]MDF7233736.1 ATP-binding cassette domain-containing protein [Proteus mirabilis]UXJ00917.1 ATP-binding cassette domain-containing protein [Proteus mirabilis]